MTEQSAKTSAVPLGLPVDPVPAAPPPPRILAGSHVTLRPIEPQADVEPLYEGSHGSAERERLWTYMWDGPFAGRDAMYDWLGECSLSRDPAYLTVHSQALGKSVGIVSFLNIVPAHRSLELGHIWYVPEVQRSEVNTEAVFLLLEETFGLRYRRVEWKCDALNERSRRAAPPCAWVSASRVSFGST